MEFNYGKFLEDSVFSVTLKGSVFKTHTLLAALSIFSEGVRNPSTPVVIRFENSLISDDMCFESGFTKSTLASFLQDICTKAYFGKKSYYGEIITAQDKLWLCSYVFFKDMQVPKGEDISTFAFVEDQLKSVSTFLSEPFIESVFNASIGEFKKAYSQAISQEERC